MIYQSYLVSRLRRTFHGMRVLCFVPPFLSSALRFSTFILHSFLFLDLIHFSCFITPCNPFLSSSKLCDPFLFLLFAPLLCFLNSHILNRDLCAAVVGGAAIFYFTQVPGLNSGAEPLEMLSAKDYGFISKREAAEQW